MLVSPQAELLQAEQEAVAAANRRDAERLAACYADDAVVTLGRGPAMIGKPAVRAWLDRLVENREVVFRYRSLRAEVSKQADLGYTVSRYEVAITRRDGSRVVETGYWTQIWRKTAGGWKLAVEMASPDPAGARFSNGLE